MFEVKIFSGFGVVNFPLTRIIPKLDVQMNWRDKIKDISAPAVRELAKTNWKKRDMPYQGHFKSGVKRFQEARNKFLAENVYSSLLFSQSTPILEDISVPMGIMLRH